VKLESHFSQCVHTVTSSSNVYARGAKLVDSVLKNFTFEKSNMTNGPRRAEPEDIGRIPNSCKDDEYYHDESDEP